MQCCYVEVYVICNPEYEIMKWTLAGWFRNLRIESSSGDLGLGTWEFNFQEQDARARSRQAARVKSYHVTLRGERWRWTGQ